MLSLVDSTAYSNASVGDSTAYIIAAILVDSTAYNNAIFVR